MPDTQYFTNIDGKYVKDAEARQQLNDLEDYVESLDQPWQPLEDGYSNFWFELTDDTLSPWLNFSAKNNDAVIDWGDGSGEVALDTLTPTHTYSKAGKYVVKVKGVTGISQIFGGIVTAGKYINILINVEVNSECTSFATSGFARCASLEHIIIPSSIIQTSSNLCNLCSKLRDIKLPDSVTEIGSATFAYCTSLSDVQFPPYLETISSSAFSTCPILSEITLPSTVTSIGNSAFAYDSSLATIHIQATTPPILGTSTFASIKSDYIIYVPVGTAETYKAASGWSAYADHILEEGQTPNRAMLAKFNSTKTDEPQDDMR